MKGPLIRILVLVLAGMLVAIMPVLTAGAAEQAAAAGTSPGELQQAADRALRAGVPAADVEIIVLRGRERGLAPDRIGELIGTVAQAGEQGVPLRPVLDRIQQGLAKGVAAERIIAAARRLAECLAAAGPLVDDLAGRGLRASSPQDRGFAVETVARALERPVPGPMVTELGAIALRHGAKLAQFDRAVRSLTLLVGAGVPADAAGRMVGRAIGRDFTDRDYARVERRVTDLLDHGAPVEEIIGAADQEVRSELGPRDSRDAGGRESGGAADREGGGRGGRGR